jgi:hypothetical protein
MKTRTFVARDVKNIPQFEKPLATVDLYIYEYNYLQIANIEILKRKRTSCKDVRYAHRNGSGSGGCRFVINWPPESGSNHLLS